MNQYDPNQARLNSHGYHANARHERAIMVGELIGDCYLWIAKQFKKLFTRT